MEAEKIEIIAAWKKGDLFAGWKFRQKIGKDQHNKGKLDSERPIHDDLRHAFAALEVHVPAILQELDPEDIPDVNSGMTGQVLSPEAMTLVGLFEVTGIEIDTEKKAVSIIATKSLELGIMPFSTPFVAYEGQYKRKLELRILVDRLLDEVQQYIDGKGAPQATQQDLFAAGLGDTDDPLVVAPEAEGVEKPKRPRGRKKKGDSEAPVIASDGSEIRDANLGDELTEPLTNYYNPGGPNTL